MYAIPCSCLAVVLLGITPLAAAVPDFETRILPILTKAGCNSGACHGAAIGRGGFRLSLLGYDPQADYESITQELKGRRANVASPERSLVLRKPSGGLPHEGGIRLRRSSEDYQLVRHWLQEGAPRGGGRVLKALELSKRSITLLKVGEKFPLRVQARFSDGQLEDVTRWVLFTPVDPAALRCTPDGELTVLRRGQHALMVRFLGEVDCATVTVPLHDAPVPAARPAANWVDTHVNQTLDLLRLPHSPRVEDRTFVRRVYLDLIGTLPEPAAVEAFVADHGPDKHTRLVDSLLARPEFADLWAYYWGDLLRIESRRLQAEGAAAFHQWVREQVARNTPLDEMARTMLLSLGDGHQVGPANFSRVPVDAGAQAEYVSQVFLGIRLQCANCHNHPLDRWTQDDYHGLAAVFARVDRTTPVVRLRERGEAIHPRTGQPAAARLPGTRFLAHAEDPREALARWITELQSPYFARAAVNRIWKALLGRGLVEPVDDHRATNPPSHPELLDALARDFAAHGCDTRRTIRTILASEAYQRSSLPVEGNRADDRYYARALVRPLPPHVLLDAVAHVTGVADSLPDRAIALGDSRIRSEPLDLLGRCARDAGCESAPASGALPLVLHALNGAWLNEKLASPTGRLARMLRHQSDDMLVVAALYELALARPPSQEEKKHWETRLAGGPADSRTARLQDFLWALLNSMEFISNQ